MSRGLFDKVCTVYSKCAVIEADEVCALLRGKKHTTEGAGADWTKIVFQGSRASLTLNRTPYLGPGFTPPNGHFNKAVMGAHNYFRTVKTRHTKAQQSLVAAITKVKTLIGCVADPHMSEEDGHYALIFAIADRFQGLIFDSDAMLAADGVVLLDKEGRAGYRRAPPGGA